MSKFKLGYVCKAGFSHVMENREINIFCIGCKKLIHSEKLSEYSVSSENQKLILNKEQNHKCNKRNLALDEAQEIRKSYIRLEEVN